MIIWNFGVYLKKKLGSSAHKFYGVLGSRGALQAKMFEHIFWENDRYSEQKTKMKNTKKIAKFVS